MSPWGILYYDELSWKHRNNHRGSGLSGSLELCYGPNVVIHKLSGKSVARALRGYILVEATLSQILLQNLLSEIIELDNNTDNNTDGTHNRLTENEIHEICDIYEKLLADPSSTDDLHLFVDSKLDECFRNLKAKLSATSRTVKLWLQFMDYIHYYYYTDI